MTMESKRKITLLLPLRILAAFDEVAKRQLGIGRNAFFAMAALLLLAKITPMLTAKRRSSLLNELEEAFSQVISEARKTA
jgi:DNA-binding ferritin-like protein